MLVFAPASKKVQGYSGMQSGIDCMNRPFWINSSVSLNNLIHPVGETGTNYLLFAYKLHSFGFCGVIPCVILGQFPNFSLNLCFLICKTNLVTQDGVGEA